MESQETREGDGLDLDPGKKIGRLGLTLNERRITNSEIPADVNNTIMNNDSSLLPFNLFSVNPADFNRSFLKRETRMFITPRDRLYVPIRLNV
jgi:hypothetical protein